jgi:hypothetical protein
MAHDGRGVGTDQVLGDEFMKAGIGGIEDRHVGEKHQEDHHEGNDEKEGAPAHAGGVKTQSRIEEIFEKIFDEEEILLKEMFFHRPPPGEVKSEE